MKKLIKITTFVLLFAMIITTFGDMGITIFASDNNDIEISEEEMFVTETWNPDLYGQEYANTTGDLTEEELETAILDTADIPEVLEEELEINMPEGEKEHVKRLYEQETELDSVIFQNRDGSKTLYSFATPIKYEDENGEIKDKRSTIEKDTQNADYEYASEENDIKVYLPKELNNNSGLKMESDGVNIEMYPVEASLDKTIGKGKVKGKTTKGKVKNRLNSKNAANSRVNKKVKDSIKGRKKEVVEYAGTFGEGTSIRYETTLNGFKEDIILEEYNGINSFSFVVKTNGKTLINRDTKCDIIDPLTGKEVGTFNNIVIYDSNGKQINGALGLEIIKPDNEYILTVSVSEEFLLEEDTVYPVFVDPSAEFDVEIGIIDTTIYDNYLKCDANSTELYAGKVSGRGVARALLRFPGLVNNAKFESLAKTQITAVTLNIKNLYPGEEGPSNIGVYKMKTSWDGNSFCNRTLWYGHGELMDTRYVANGYGDASDRYKWDITSAAEDWKDGRNGGMMGHYGVELQAINENYNKKAFGSYQQYYPPYVTVDYYEHRSVTSMSVAKSRYDINVRDTMTPDFRVYPSDADNKKMVFINHGDACIELDYNTGKVKGVSEGRAEVWAYSIDNPYVSQKTEIYVKAVKATGIVLGIMDANVKMGEYRNVDASVVPYNTTNSGLQYYSENPNVATVDAFGTIRGVGIGSTNIVVKSLSNSGLTKYYYVTVGIPVTSISLSGPGFIRIGETGYLSYIFAPRDTTQRDVVYSSSNTQVATVAKDGKITGVGKGIATIRVQSAANSKVYSEIKIGVTHEEVRRRISYDGEHYSGFSSKMIATPVPQARLDEIKESNGYYKAKEISEKSMYFGYLPAARFAALELIYENAYVTALASMAPFQGALASMIHFPDAGRALLHFLANTGDPIDNLDFHRMNNEWDYAKSVKMKDMNETLRAAEQFALEGYKIRFVSTEEEPNNAPNDGTNWFRTVGNYYTKIECEVEATSNNTYTAQIKYTLNDFYNWRKDNNEYGFSVPVEQEELWELHHGGRAKDYEITGTEIINITWRKGEMFFG